MSINSWKYKCFFDNVCATGRLVDHVDENGGDLHVETRRSCCPSSTSAPTWSSRTWAPTRSRAPSRSTASHSPSASMWRPPRGRLSRTRSSSSRAMWSRLWRRQPRPVRQMSHRRAPSRPLASRPRTSTASTWTSCDWWATRNRRISLLRRNSA